MATLHLTFANKEVEALYSINQNFADDAGYNLIFCEDIELKAGETRRIDFCLGAAMYNATGNSSAYYIFPRSSISKSAIRLANSVGIIDKGYRGNLMVVVDVKSDYILKRGTSLFQVCGASLECFTTMTVDSLDKTSRGSGAFGSTDSESRSSSN